MDLSIQEFQAKVVEIVENIKFGTRRTNNMEMDEFHHLHETFEKNSVYFSLPNKEKV
jgi:hypothetical protein